MIWPRLSPTRSAVFFTINAFAISWLCWLPLVASERGLNLIPLSVSPLLVLLGTFGPFFSAVTIVARRSGFRGLGQFLGQALRWRVGVRWYAYALLAPAAVRLAVVALHISKGGSVSDLSDPALWLAIPSTFLIVLLIGGPTGEEFGWRGFLLQRVQPLCGLLGAAILIGLVSALWHLPLFWISGTAQSHLPFALFVVRTVALSVISTWLYNGTGRSLLFVLLFHASLNTWPNTVSILEAQGTIAPYTSTTILYAAWGAQLVILGLLRGRGDRRKPQEASPAVAA
ncbi:MAG TPA: CPBP family intramembrane glutamic endopeptidase [Candidatus Dormibacteraeota bacterium]|nr:CPBP family intramembrane glutamic endopeptidase [Candidatus Dormibacteraeota bacterium]